MDGVPLYVPAIFVLTTFAMLAFLIEGLRSAGTSQLGSKILFLLLPLWLILTAALSLSGFYVDEAAMPLRLIVFGILPAVILIILYFVIFRSTVIEKLPLRALTLLHVIQLSSLWQLTTLRTSDSYEIC